MERVCGVLIKCLFPINERTLHRRHANVAGLDEVASPHANLTAMDCL